MTSLVAGLSNFLSATIDLYKSSLVVIMFSISELALASFRCIVSKNNVGFGRFVIMPFNCAKALLASMVLRRILVVSKFAFGGSSGKLLIGIFLLKSVILNKGKSYLYYGNEGKYTKKLLSFVIRG